MSSPESSRDYDLLDRLVEEFNERYRNGERPSLKEYCDRYPHLADDLREMLPALAQVEGVKELPPDEPASAPLPRITSLGDFRILREVGHGGMGVVYEAEQVSLGRRVALKVLTDRLMRDPRQKRRFEREAKAAAKLHHTNIVPVFGTGTHENTPYYVMQFIQGMGLDAVVEELAQVAPGIGAIAVAPLQPPAPVPREVSQIARSLMTGEFRPSANDEEPADVAPVSEPVGSLTHRPSDTSGVSSSSISLPGQSGATTGGKSRKLTYWQSVAKIGAQVADALDHAHNQGVIHRDIKPSNLLLDLAGTVWVTDFGLAKAEGADNLTDTGDVLGTLRYMPPEAFDSKADHRGDLYSLGLTLYELVALRPAFDERDRNRLIKQVTTAEPEPVGRTRRGVPRDLETIIGKAIDRDRSRRYQTAAELRDDLQRFVDDEPIRARRQSQWERARRWCRHHPAVAALLAFIVLLLLGVTTASVLAAAHFDRLARSEANAAADERKARWEAEQAQRKAQEAERLAREAGEREAKLRKEAEAAKTLAEANFVRARSAVDDYLTRVSENQLLQAPGLSELRKELLLSALGFYQQFLKDRGDDPSIRAGLAEAHLRVAKIQSQLTNTNEAFRAYSESQRYYRELLKTDPDNVDYQHGLAQTLAGLQQYPAAIALWTKLVQPESPRFQAELANAYNAQALRYSDSRRVADALASHQQAYTLRERLVQLAPDNPEYRRDLGGTLNNIGSLLAGSGRRDDALDMYRRAVEHVREARKRTPYDLTTGRFLAIGLQNVASQLRALRRNDEAVQFYTEAVSLWQELAFDHPNVPELYSRLYALSLDVSRYQAELGKTAEAEQSLSQAQYALRRLPTEGPYNQFRLASIHARTADTIGKGKAKVSAVEETERRKQADLALDYLKKAVAAGYRSTVPLMSNPDLVALRERDEFKMLAAEVQDKAEAEKAHYERIAELHKAIQEAETLARSETATPEEQERAGAELVQLRAQLLQLQPSLNLKVTLAANLHSQGLIQLDQGNLDEAGKLLKQAVTLREELAQQYRGHVVYQADLLAAQVDLGQWLVAVGQRAEGVRVREKGLADLEALIEKNPTFRDVVERWARTSLSVAGRYLQMGLIDEAAAHYERVFQKHSSTELSEWRTHALLRLMVGDTDGHRKACEEVVKRFTIEPNTWEAHHFATLWSMGSSPSSVDRERIRQLTQAYVEADPNTTWKQFYHGMVLYRLNRLEEAELLVNYNWPQGLPARAMVAHRLGRADEARRLLTEADARYRQHLSVGLRDSQRTFLQGLHSNDHDRLQFLILRNEAYRLIEGKLPPMDALTTLFRARAFALIGDEKKADTLFADAVKGSQEDPNLWALRSRVFADLGRQAEAVADQVRARKVADAVLAAKIPDDAVAGLAEYLEQSAVNTGWIPVRPASATSEAKGTLVVRPDSTIEPPSMVAGDDTITLTVPTDLNGITAVRLDVFSSDAKAAKAEFVKLVGFSLASGPLGDEGKPVAARVVGAVKLAKEVDGWSAALDPARFHSFVLFPEQPVGGVDGSTLTLKLRLRGPKDTAPLGPFRLSVTRVTGETLKSLEAADTTAVAAPPIRGRFVRIELPGTSRVLNLIEVEVLSGAKNVARTGRASASSVRQQYGGPPSRAIDGNTNTDAGGTAFTETNYDTNPWWEVDLGAEYALDRIRIYNRTDNERKWISRLNGYTLRVLDANRKDVFRLTNQPAPPKMAEHIVGHDPFALPEEKPDPEIARVPAGAARERAFLAAVQARAGRLAEAADLFGRAIEVADSPVTAWPVYRYAMTLDAVFSELSKLRPDDLELWLARGRYLVEQGRNPEADEAFANAAKLTPNELHRFLDGGWWVAGPYPNTVDVPAPPDRFADPSKPIAMASGVGEYVWQPVPPRPPFTSTSGRLALEQLLSLTPADSAYALAYIYSPDDKPTLLNILAPNPVRVWLNSRQVLVADKPATFQWDSTNSIPVTLRKGRNQLLVRVAGAGTQKPTFYARLGDHPFERGYVFARAGLWAEAEPHYAEFFRRFPNDPSIFRFHTQLLWAAGKRVEARTAVEQWLKLHAATTDVNILRQILVVAMLFPENGAEVSRLVDLVVADLDKQPDRAEWRIKETGLCCIAAGKWETAAKLLEEGRGNEDWSMWPALALCYHHLGQRDKAVALVHKSEEVLATALATQLERPNLHLPADSYSVIPFLAHLDRAREELKIKPAPAADPAEMQARFRKLLAELAPATAPHDYVLLRYPHDHLSWVRFGRRLGELDRWDDARTAFDRATQRQPTDPQVWKARAQAYAALGKWDEAAADFAKAIELIPAEQRQVNYWKDDAGIHTAATVDDEVFARLIQKLPKDSGLWARRFRHVAEAGDWKRAAATLEDGRDVYLGNNSEARRWQALLTLYRRDVESYRRQCEAMLKRATGTWDVWTALHTTVACLLTPDAIPDAKAILPLAEFLATGTEKHPLRVSFLRWRALAAYRTGDYTGTVLWLQRAGEGGDGIGNITWHSLRALAEHRLGKPDAARPWFEKARTGLANRPQPERGQFFGASWESWLVAELLFREAEQLLDAKRTDRQN